MANDTRSVNEIERNIERKRSDLSETLDEIQSRFTPESMVNEVVRQVRTHGGDVGQSLGRSVKQNPMALALTGVGLAWLIFGRSHDRSDGRAASPANSRALPAGRDWGSAGDVPDDLYPVGRNGASSYPEWYTADDGSETSRNGAMQRAGSAVGDAASAAGSSIGDAASRTGSAITGAAAAAGDSAGSVAALASEKVQGAYEGAADRAARLRDRVARGTEDLTAEGRERVLAARRKAIEARRQVAAKARRGWESGRDTAVDLFEDQPLVAGALAIAVGAALGASLPRTRYEDDAFGEQSDALMAEAERIFEEEREKARKVVKAARDEVESIAREKGGKADSALKSAVEEVKDEVEDASRRVTKTVRQEADAQDLGKPRAG